MQRLMTKILDWIYPAPLHCLSCSAELQKWEVGLGLCRKCVQNLCIYSAEGLSQVSGLREQYFDQLQGVALYQGLMKDWIYRFKYDGQREWVFPLVELMVEQGIVGEWDGVIPVPLHESKLYTRGFNQAVLLARGMAFYLGVPCLECLVRVKATEPQNRLTAEERHKNLHGVFSLLPGAPVQGKHWLIVDDIFTTGATVNEAARVLKAAGSERVGVFVLASGRMI